MKKRDEEIANISQRRDILFSRRSQVENLEVQGSPFRAGLTRMMISDSTLSHYQSNIFYSNFKSV